MHKLEGFQFTQHEKTKSSQLFIIVNQKFWALFFVFILARLGNDQSECHHIILTSDNVITYVEASLPLDMHRE